MTNRSGGWTKVLAALAATIAVYCAAVNAQTSSPASTQAPATSTTAPAAKTASKPATTAPARKTQPTTAAGTKPATGAALTTKKQKDSYALGLNMARGLEQQPIDIDIPSLLQGMKDALQKAKPQLTDDQIKAALDDLNNQAQAKIQAQNQASGEANLKQGTEFLAENKSKPGVVTTPSGLQYKILTAGTGPKPTAADTVVCDYSGNLIDGTVFDSSYKRKQTATFPVSGVIKGWTEALQMMPVGSKWELYIPPELAYGSRGTGPIGPNATLIFQVELHSIQGK
jgi:FKBP-type peptidyl-prolyl cis-trans isomerase FklB